MSSASKSSSGSGDGDEVGMELSPRELASVDLTTLPAGALDQNATHGGRRRREEMAAPAETLPRAFSGQPQVRFVHQRRRLERLPRLLAGEFLCGQLAKLVVDKRQELIDGIRIAAFDCCKDTSDFVHHLEPP